MVEYLAVVARDGSGVFVGVDLTVANGVFVVKLYLCFRLVRFRSLDSSQLTT